MTMFPDTVTEALTLLAREGYAEDFNQRHRVGTPGAGRASARTYEVSSPVGPVG